MVNRITDNIYRIQVTLPKNPLRYLNSYYIRGDERDLLIDTGFSLPECYNDLRTGLEQVNAKFSHLDVLATHFHADHAGMVKDFVSKDGTIFMSELDFNYIVNNVNNEINAETLNARLAAEGFPEDHLKWWRKNTVGMELPGQIKEMRYHKLQPDEIISFGGHDLQVLAMPGHTPGNIMLWSEKEGIMFTSDHILFGISPNITNQMGVEDSLGDYLNSLEKAKAYPVKISLPGHREAGDYHQRIDQLLAHHEKRLAETFELVQQNPGATAYEIAGKMRWHIRAKSWDDFPIMQQRFAVGEAIAHLDHLIKLGKIRKAKEGGLWKYHSA